MASHHDAISTPLEQKAVTKPEVIARFRDGAEGKSRSEVLEPEHLASLRF
ncbi:hypothetical protein [Longimycelium tulufanense]|nr:hypothetical protein [Longimycelium tulufanense]